jgi:hypothetical protein
VTIEELMANAEELHRAAVENFARAYACWQAGDREGARAFGQDGRATFAEAAIIFREAMARGYGGQMSNATLVRHVWRG